eukprot:gnl/MRDRNA2_/MRDRNA2_141648_c0_seq1.p3 gnl/MRDRNA2_/MRDRNA2_141648_c0~~gnl/MRDRNA2_/MRDRNA2_141648_c0_seq1.p3  ORF type:complete len:111 (+),score=16.78 gnl/MRDRNA2_/MRDRNA2_141648_c0_seq1:81-413(+)
MPHDSMHVQIASLRECPVCNTGAVIDVAWEISALVTCLVDGVLGGLVYTESAFLRKGLIPSEEAANDITWKNIIFRVFAALVPVKVVLVGECIAESATRDVAWKMSAMVI